MANPTPLPAPDEVLFKQKWNLGKTKVVRIPAALESHLLAIARCIDSNPAIASQAVEYAQSLSAE